jgi:BMFP domain-containing protein YqiC
MRQKLSELEAQVESLDGRLKQAEAAAAAAPPRPPQTSEP